MLAVLLFSLPARSQEPLFDQDPYDVITLDENNDYAVLRVWPLDLPGRRVPDPLPIRGKLRVRLVERPEAAYEMDWHTIDRIVLFEELVLKEANERVQAGRLDEAYDYFDYLLGKDPKLPGLAGAIDDYFHTEAQAFLGEGQYEDALATLQELHARSPKREGLDKALGEATDKLVPKYVKADDYWAARQLLRNLIGRFPQHPVVKKWEAQFAEEAAALLAEGRKAADAGRLDDAHRLGRRLMHVWPHLPEGKPFIDSIQKQYPRVVVGVTLPAADWQPGRMHDWASRRSSRLIYRTLMEFAGRGIEGGEYVCPLGGMTTEAPDPRLVFQLASAPARSAGADALTGYDLARQLLAMATPGTRAYQLDWAELLDRVSVPDVFTVTAQMRRPHLRPEALFRTLVAGYARSPGPEESSSGESSSGNGPYTVQSHSEDEVVYVASAGYSAAGPSQPKELVERHYPKATKAIQALQRRQIDVLDRVNPWDLDEVGSISGVIVEPYTVPLVHCLVPNPRKPFTARRAFRRALAYGIHREAILKHLLRGAERPGCRVVSGPFSPGISPDDPLDYAYDHTVEPRAYEPRLAIALKQVTLFDVAGGKKKEKKEGKEEQKRGEEGEKEDEAKAVELITMPEIVLAHPPHEIARVACTSIKRQLKLVGIPVALRALPPEMPARIPDDVDLLYVELAMWEPLVDARRLLGEQGIAGGSSPHMSLALRQLDEATDWAEAGARLRYIHWLVHKEACVVPLWQLTDHFAYQRSLTGVAMEPVSLYQDIEMWQPATQFPAEER